MLNPKPQQSLAPNSNQYISLTFVTISKPSKTATSTIPPTVDQTAVNTSNPIAQKSPAKSASQSQPIVTEKIPATNPIATTQITHNGKKGPQTTQKAVKITPEKRTQVASTHQQNNSQAQQPLTKPSSSIENEHIEAVNSISTDSLSKPVKTLPPQIIEPMFRTPPHAPRYPKIARKRGQQGTVWLEIWLDSQGQQKKRIILTSSGFASLDQSALKTVAKWQFAPYIVNGHGQISRVQIPVQFALN